MVIAMKVIRARNKIELIEQIKSMEGEHGEVYINMRPTLDIVEKIIERFPNVEKIMCPPSLHVQTSRKVFKKLADKGIKLEPGEFRVGRPKKYDDETIAEIINLRNQGMPAKQISERLNIPLRTVYFYLQ